MQVSQLSRLTQLSLSNCFCLTPGGMGAIETLSSLRRLHAINCHLPACLPALTSLEHLCMTALGADLTQQLEAALAQLTGLTSLVVQAATQRIPAALGGLSRLQRLCLRRWGHGELTDARLPAGPWLASIRWLGLPFAVLEQCTELLASAQQLEYLCSMGLPELPLCCGADTADRWRRFWRLLAAHPPLRCFLLDAPPEGDGVDAPLGRPSADLLRALLLLQGMRPGLHIRCVVQAFEYEVCVCTDIPDDDPPAF